MNKTDDKTLGKTLGRTWGRGTRTAMGALTLLAVGAGSCTDTGTTATVSYAYDNPYVYSTYYPVDTAYAGYYWADSWNYYAFYYEGAVATGLANTGVGGAPSLHGAAGANGAAGAIGAAGANGAAGAHGAAGATGAGGAGGGGPTTVRSTIASVVEALARGESVCPGQVTITPKTAAPACA